MLHGTVIDSNGCYNSSTLEVRVDPLINVYFPTAFSPNYDGTNDMFLPGWKDGIVQSIKQFEVFDRWGNSIYKTSTIPANEFQGWDGTMNGTLMGEGVYLYMITLVFINGSTTSHTGEILSVH